MKCLLRKRIYAYTLLLILLAAIVGQKVHIYTEDPLHFAAFCGDLLPDNGAQSVVAEKCVVDNFCFFSCVCVAMPVFEAHFAVLGGQSYASTCSKQAGDIRLQTLRAPPVAV